MAHPVFYIKQGDTSPYLQVTLKDGDGAVVNLTGATAVFSMRRGGSTTVSEQSATVVSPATAGVVRYTWGASDTATPGMYEGEFEVTFSGGEIQTYPNAGYIEINVLEQIA